ncbi:PLDc N-terminal domain-containing protein [Halorubrum sp. 2020YC2]|uniref:PLDc N-terminal domain-containing protein n=1 Tax=Halorubrum sp. 2020YC2 TaxID=2836432 RepID=UPI001BE76DAB|nr:PLDc N-terminal domain-containing protein [Halorubrum sp. 2020YC2]QWC20593.1 PLDc N-terminal domain-containing protein [Halorubrum sp. 2020YC2]
MSPLLLQGAAAGGIALLITLVFFVVHLAMIVWTYSDAQSRSDHPPILWALIVFFAPILGVLLYLIIGRDSY